MNKVRKQLNNKSFMLRREAKKLLKLTALKIFPVYRVLLENKKQISILTVKIFSLEEKNKQQAVALLEKIEKLKKILIRTEKNFLPKFNDENISILGEKIDIPNNHKSKIEHYECSIEEFFDKIEKFILKTDIILDVGCGIRPQTFFTPKVHLCIEPFEKYREIIKPFFPNYTNFIFFKGDALDAIRSLDDSSVDTVFMMDLIEHLEKNDGLALLKEADRVAKKQIIIFTPLGFYPMHYKEEGEKDAWGLGGTSFQEHKSGWLPEDFDKTWDFHICENCHEAFLPEEKKNGKRYSAFLAIKTKNFKSFPVSLDTPELVKKIYEERAGYRNNF